MVGITGIILSSEELKTQDVEQNEKLDSTTNMFTNAAAATGESIFWTWNQERTHH